MDIFERLIANPGPLGKHSKHAHGYFAFPRLEGDIHPYMSFNGRQVLTWSLNNYLGLANHPEVRATDAAAAAQYGMATPMGARMMSGNSTEHEALEQELSTFVQKPATMLLNYGYQGIMSVIDAIVNRHDVVVYDAECHACIVDGLRMHTGRRFVFPHNNIESLEKQLIRAQQLTEETGGGILVITEGVFGMSGNQGKLKEIAELKKIYPFRFLVDDAHGFGTMGPTGAGTGEAQGVMADIDIYFSTFAKSMASIGAFVSSEEGIINYLLYNTRSQIFAKSLPMPLVVGARKRLELLRTQPQLRADLWNIVNGLQGSLRQHGFEIGTTTSPVTPVILQGDERQAASLVLDLRENHSIFCSIVIYPVIPRGQLILRLIPTALHTMHDVEKTVKALQMVKKKLDDNFYRDSPLDIGVEAAHQQQTQSS